MSTLQKSMHPAMRMFIQGLRLCTSRVMSTIQHLRRQAFRVLNSNTRFQCVARRSTTSYLFRPTSIVQQLGRFYLRPAGPTQLPVSPSVPQVLGGDLLTGVSYCAAVEPWRGLKPGRFDAAYGCRKRSTRAELRSVCRSVRLCSSRGVMP